MKTEKPQAVKYFIGALFSNNDLLEKAKLICEEKIGPLDEMSEPFLFDATHYYDEEMGQPIHRQFFSFDSLMNPGDLAELKVLCNEIEAQLMVDEKRQVNLDIGYLDLHKLILASAKYNGQKIYLDQGIYADLTLIFERGEFHAVENTFPDFKSGSYKNVFMNFRKTYKSQLKAM